MTPTGVRVFLVVPVTWHWYFEARRKYSIAWYAKRALDVADAFSPGAGVDVFLYGKKDGEDHTSVLRTELKPAGLESWVKDWAVRPNGDPGPLDDLRPTNPQEDFFGTKKERSYPGPVAAVEEVLKWTEQLTGDKLIIFWLDSNIEKEELVRTIARADRSDIFWQFFGDGDKLSYSFWRKDGLERGGLVPNIWTRRDRSWSRRSITRGFRKWRNR
ncbi:hypothetical protein [Streptomyces sp. NPDC059063]|uniref:hypothetical protein n=1 Tax=unclassified Streptomyces TaxID=2593676 RepID=UPI0036C07634